MGVILCLKYSYEFKMRVFEEYFEGILGDTAQANK